MEARLERPNPLFLTPLDSRNSFKSNNMKRIRTRASYTIYSITTLSSLFEQQNSAKEVPDLRFLVDLNGHLWFARETHDHEPAAPAHKYLANENNCKTAGNLFFDEERKTLLKINHKSGDYRPSFQSLNWLLAILILNEDKLPFVLPKELEIDELNDVGGLIKTYKTNIDVIKNWAKTFILNQKLVTMLSKQPSITKEIKIEPPERILAEEETAVIGRSLFGRISMFAKDDEDDDLPLAALERTKNRGIKKLRLEDSPERSPSP